MRKIETARAELEKDDQRGLDMLEKKLGPFATTPLGKAALARHAASTATNGHGKKDKPDPKHDQQPALAKAAGDSALDDLTKH